MSSLFIRNSLSLSFRRSSRSPVSLIPPSSTADKWRDTIHRSFSTTSGNKRRMPSSAFSTAAAAMEDDEGLEDQSVETQQEKSNLQYSSYHRLKQTQQQQQTQQQEQQQQQLRTQSASTAMPRLEALRHRLKEETPGEMQQSKTPTTLPVSSGNNGCSTESSSLQSKEDEEGRKLEELLQQLDSLPMPSGPATNYPYPATVDRFGRQHSYLRISLSERCNLRCLYCMPEDGVPLQPESHLLSNEEIVQLSKWFVTHGGITKLRLTGGEPLLRKDLPTLIHNIRQATTIGDRSLEQIGMTTNGVTLSKHLPDLIEAGLTHVNISLDSLDATKFSKLTRRPTSYHDRVLSAIEDCAKALPHRTKINCVVMPDNVNELEDFCRLTKEMPIDVRFIEYMPFNDNLWDTSGFISYAQMQEQLSGRLERLEDGPNDTTKWWTWEDDKNGTSTTSTSILTSSSSSSTSFSSQGRIGFITSMSEHFCGTCNRLRITADGKLKVCLFGSTEVSLRDLLRRSTTSSNAEEWLTKVVHYSVQRKHFKLGGHSDMQDLKLHSAENRPMTLIGG